MGLIKTGITAGAALGGVKMVMNSMEKQRANSPGYGGGYDNRSGSPMGYQAQVGSYQQQMPPHPLCNCPYCPQNQQQHQPQISRSPYSNDQYQQQPQHQQYQIEGPSGSGFGGPPDYSQQRNSSGYMQSNMQFDRKQ